MENRVRIREATNSLRRTPEIAGFLDKISNAKSDEEIRLARKAYYTAMDRALKKALPDLKERIEEMTYLAVSRLDYTRVRSHERTQKEEVRY